ncbi:type IV pilin [Candidatus Poseidoniales archaeon]|nr:type IV pilin [Candidatus Poseidoniales archaeon]MDA8837664.1 type IV pilin [Candidatus Poseidoniales archaeon]MDA9571244.1 type IV pilin [Candidatus Poseidoniales archaeon]MDB2322790.1 type IV pilin [Candidatus Poseidoniales archaeon]MDB2623936.1 type IV pilin [Candidatus Poseidoniales archaeon]
MQNENMNDEAVSPVIATILMVAITVVLAGVLYVWASSLAEGNTDGNLALYQFGAEDANGDTTAGTDDNMVRVTMSQGGDLNWASISVKISVNNGAPVTCDNPGATGGSCGLVEFGSTSDQVWSVGDGVTIVESGQDLCTAGETCEVKVTITDTREGKTLDESTSFAE